MISLILGLLVCVVVAGLVVAMVAIPARREGRDLLTARGEDMLARGGDLVTGIKERGEAVVDLVTPGSSDTATGEPTQTPTEAPAQTPTQTPTQASTQAPPAASTPTAEPTPTSTHPATP